MIEGKPSCVTDEMLIFLDELRDLGETNMFGSVPYLEAEFPGNIYENPELLK